MCNIWVSIATAGKIDARHVATGCKAIAGCLAVMEADHPVTVVSASVDANIKENISLKDNNGSLSR